MPLQMLTVSSNTMKTLRTLILILIIYQIVIPLLVLGGSITFGHGLGDLGMIIIFCVVLIGVIILYIWTYKTKNEVIRNFGTWILFASNLSIVFYLTASFTIWRGGEYGWNGDIFFPSSQQRAEQRNQEAETNEKLKNASITIEKNPTNFDGYMERARINKHNSNYQNAITDYLSALKIDSTSLSANLEAGEVYWDLDNFTMALKYNEKALQIDTSYFLAKHRVEVLRQEVKDRAK
jgi:tetratricopeptide (TPR) repeat protein